MSNSKHINPSPSDLYKETVQRIERQRVIPLLTGKSAEHIFNAAKGISERSGCLIGVDFKVQGIKDRLKSLKKKGQREYGVFSVRTAKETRTATSSGALFVFSPYLDKSIVKKCKTEKVFHAPGALTPNEVLNCIALRAEAVSVFPCSVMGGVEWINRLEESFPSVKFIATDAMTTDDVRSYLDAGAYAVAPIIDTEETAKTARFLEEIQKSDL
jgi:2-dehydro-3-deoxyphosphogluconate aldolase/(4S)-4-hydroxy-2-oxoglutarate aldolase